MEVEFHAIVYNIPKDIHLLKHKKMNILERIASWGMQSHICQICSRKEIWSVSGWLQINDPIYKDDLDCSVVCIECANFNPEIFGLNEGK